jgi:hypothetical protein
LNGENRHNRPGFNPQIAQIGADGEMDKPARGIEVRGFIVRIDLNLGHCAESAD